MMGGRRVGSLLELGPERNLGIYRLAELRCLVAFAAGGRLARQGAGLVGGHRPDYYRLCLYRREYVLERPAFLRHFVSSLSRTLFQTAFFRFRRKRRLNRF